MCVYTYTLRTYSFSYVLDTFIHSYVSYITYFIFLSNMYPHLIVESTALQAVQAFLTCCIRHTLHDLTTTVADHAPE